jgi:hypothetical protein
MPERDPYAMQQSKASPLALVSDTPEDIAEMLAEAARVDALFQRGAISTFLPLFFGDLLGDVRGSDRVAEGAGAREERPTILPAA